MKGHPRTGDPGVTGGGLRESQRGLLPVRSPQTASLLSPSYNPFLRHQPAAGGGADARYLSRWETRLVTRDRSPGLLLSLAFQRFGQSCRTGDLGGEPAGRPSPKPRPRPGAQASLRTPRPAHSRGLARILEDGGVEGPLLPVLGGQGNLAAEPPGRKDRSGGLRAGQAGAGVPTWPPQ